MDGWAWWMMVPLMVLFWGFVAWLIVVLVRQVSASPDRRAPTERDR